MGSEQIFLVICHLNLNLGYSYIYYAEQLFTVNMSDVTTVGGKRKSDAKGKETTKKIIPEGGPKKPRGRNRKKKEASVSVNEAGEQCKVFKGRSGSSVTN